MKNHSFLQALKSLALLPFILLTGCMSEGVGILVYDLAESRVVSFIPQENQERQSLLIQRGANGDTFFTFDENGKRLSQKGRWRDGKPCIAERDIKGDIVAQWETAIPPPYYPMTSMALSPGKEKVAYIIGSVRPAPYLVKFSGDFRQSLNEARITTKDGSLLKILNERPNGISTLNKGIHWLSDETVITSSHLWKDRSDQIVKYDLKTDEETNIDYSFGWALTTNYLLPSPDNRYVLLLRKSENYIDVLDPWMMTIVDEIQVIKGTGIANIGSTWLNNDEFLTWDKHSSLIIRYNISTRQLMPVKAEFPTEKYKISTFMGNHFILRKDGDYGKWSYNVKTKELRKITSYAVGCIYPLNDNIILLDRAIRP